MLLAVKVAATEVTHSMLERNKEAVEAEVAAWVSDPSNMAKLLARLREKEAAEEMQ